MQNSVPFVRKSIKIRIFALEIALMKQNMSKRKRITSLFAVVVILLLSAVAVGSCYMMNYSLSNPLDKRTTAQQRVEQLRERCPWINAWVDSIYQYKAIRDTFIIMKNGERQHALFLRSAQHTNRTVVVVHGYKVRAEGMLHIAFLYHHDLGWNVLLPDLHGHGLSDGENVQMGWKDRYDVLRWSQVANFLFADSTGHTQQVLHGISMGAATVMAVSGENTPYYIKGFVEDCGYGNVWDEFAWQLKEQFSLPAFPLMYSTSWLCKMRNGWSFEEAQQIDQVRKCKKPMLFIHGDKDDFVPTSFVYPLYQAKSGKKDLLIAKGSKHAVAYSDHRAEYTEKVKTFVYQMVGVR